MTLPDASQKALLRLWKSGIPLDSAWVEFAVFFDDFAHRALRTHPDNDADVLGLENPRYKELSKGWLPRTWEARKKKLSITTKNERIRLLGEIYAGRLWAIGLRTPDLNDERVRIPSELFSVNTQRALARSGKIDWIEEKLATANESYFHIRVVRSPGDHQTDEDSSIAYVGLASISDESGSFPPEVDQIMDELKRAGDSHIDLTGVRPRIEDQTVQTDDGTWSTRAGRPPIDPRIWPKIEALWKLPSFRTIKSRTRQAQEVRAQILGEEYRDKDKTPNLTTRMIARLIGKFSKAQPR